MTTKQQNIQTFLDLINHYPSPHNGQPIRMIQVDDNCFDVYFEKDRGLQAVDISFIFSFVTMGVFVEHMMACAKALGHTLSFKHCLPTESALRGEGNVKFTSCSVEWSAGMLNNDLTNAIKFRQTSRKKYHAGVNSSTLEETVNIAADGGMTLLKLSNEHARQAIWLNQRAVFDDMFDEGVRQELNHWLRYTTKQKQNLKDGLSYDCMEVNGGFMKVIVDHPSILRSPGLSKVIKRYYLRTMKDNSDVFYIMAPFGSEKNAFDVGTIVMRIWILFSEKEYYIHPFGTIMSNHDAHKDFMKLVDVTDESRETNYLVFIFRAGKSDHPVQSLRIPINEHLLMETFNV